jgi:hypothetical protein
LFLQQDASCCVLTRRALEQAARRAEIEAEREARLAELAVRREAEQVRGANRYDTFGLFGTALQKILAFSIQAL